MTKFKVGDNVRVIASNRELREFSCTAEIVTGDIRKVTEIKEESNSVRLDGLTGGWVKPKDIELAQDSNLTLKGMAQSLSIGFLLATLKTKIKVLEDAELSGLSPESALKLKLEYYEQFVEACEQATN